MNKTELPIYESGVLIVEKYKELQAMVKRHVASNPQTEDEKIKCAMEVHHFLMGIFLEGRAYEDKQLAKNLLEMSHLLDGQHGVPINK